MTGDQLPPSSLSTVFPYAGSGGTYVESAAVSQAERGRWEHGRADEHAAHSGNAGVKFV